MSDLRCCVAVTGMNATDNPAPGVAVCRSLRSARDFGGRLVGFGYDALDPGFYSERLLDGGAILPFPSDGCEALEEALLRARDVLAVDVLVPTLDSELRAVARLEGRLDAAGIATFSPRLPELEAVSKARLHALAPSASFRVPDSEVVSGPAALPAIADRLGLPFVIKGPYYGATVVRSLAQARAAYDKYVATWGVPIIAQRFVAGDEFNVAALGDGRGHLVGAVPMRKMALTELGKGWAGVTIEGRDLLATAERVVGALAWRGGLEVECIRDRSSGELFVIEINPRFPAWIYLATAAGQNLPLALVRLAQGEAVPRLPPHRVGVQFVRISLDQIASLDTFGSLASRGLLPLSA